MHYTISRDGQTLGTHSSDDIRALLQSGQLRPTDQAKAADAAGTISVADLLTPPAAGATPPVESFLVRRAQQQFGPYPFPYLQRYTLEGRIQPTDLAWCAGMAAWEPVAQVLQRRGVAMPASSSGGSDESLKWVLPVGRSGLAIAAGYLGLFSVLLVPAPFALVCGLLAVRDLKQHPAKGGRGRAWFGLIAGGIGTLALFGLLLAAALEPRSVP